MSQVHSVTKRDIWVGKLLYPLYRWPGIALAASPVLVASGLAIRDDVFALVPAVVIFIAAWLIQLAGVLAGVYRNFAEHPSDAEHPALSSALADGTLQLNSIRNAAFACFAFVLLATAYLFTVAGVGVVIFALAGMAASWAYSSGPLPLGKAGLADLHFFVFFGTVAVLGTYYVQAAAHDPGMQLLQISEAAYSLRVMAAGIPIGALAANLLVIDDIRDRDFDAVKGKQTITVRFGLTWGRAEFAAFVALAYLSLIAMWMALALPASVMLPLLTLPYAVFVVRMVMTRDSYRDLLPAKRHLAKLMLLFSVLMAAGLCVA